MSKSPVRRALISVSDKSNIVEFCQELIRLDIDIISTGGTADILRENKVKVTDVSDYTGFPEIMGGRVKTLHPKIHGALLGRIDIDSELMTKHGIIPIDLVVVNLYPFEKTISNTDVTLDEAIDNIDIGGPSMLRAAAKNFHRVTVVCDAQDYTQILNELKNNNAKISNETRFNLAKKAFTHTAHYDAAISTFLNNLTDEKSDELFPSVFTLDLIKKQDLRYGENPHQKAAFYRDPHSPTNGITQAEQIQGKPLSYNNIADADAALECVRQFDHPACVIVKHANPSGVALAKNSHDAYLRAYATDPTSAFGGIIAFNQAVDEITAQSIIQQQFVEVIIAPHFEKAALNLFQQKPNVRIMLCEKLIPLTNELEFKRVTGGVLIQERDIAIYQESLRVVTQVAPTPEQMTDLEFAWKVAKFVKSNAIVFAKDTATLGIGAGQMSRVDSTTIAAEKAKTAHLTIKGAVMASDAFFPFKDVIEQAALVGIKAIIQPGGSIKDEEVIAAADKAGVAMVFTGMRHFKH